VSPRASAASRVALALAALPLAACAGPTGRVQDPDEPAGVDVRAASFDILDGMAREGTQRILDQAQSGLSGSTARARLVFAGIENNSDERLGEKKSYLYDNVDTLVTRSGMFDVVSRSFVENALSRIGEAPRAELLIDPQVRRKLVEQLEQDEGRDYIRYILFGKLNNASADTGRGTSEKKYVLVMELVDARTGLQWKTEAFGRKAYTE
jgi:hypothetical protein